MPWYDRTLAAVTACCPTLLPTQAANLALLVAAVLTRRTLVLTDLARAFPTPAVRRVPMPKHDLHHRLKRLWRFVDNPKIDAVALQAAAIPYALAGLGLGRRIGLAIDWTLFDVLTPAGRRVHYQVLRIAVPWNGRAVPLMQVAVDRYHIPAGQSQNSIEERALWAVLDALPAGVRPIVLADRGFARGRLFAALRARGVDFVIRVRRGTWLTEADGRGWKLGSEGTARGQVRWHPGVRFALADGRPSDVVVNAALCWRVPGRRTNARKPPKEPWYLATTLGCPARAVCWYWRRGWIEQSFRDAKQRFGLERVRVGTPARLTRLLLGLTLALTWLLLAAPPAALGAAWAARVGQRGRLSWLTRVLAWFDLHPHPSWPAAPATATP
jgi:hypothetical protein